MRPPLPVAVVSAAAQCPLACFPGGLRPLGPHRLPRRPQALISGSTASPVQDLAHAHVQDLAHAHAPPHLRLPLVSPLHHHRRHHRHPRTWPWSVAQTPHLHHRRRFSDLAYSLTAIPVIPCAATCPGSQSLWSSWSLSRTTLKLAAATLIIRKSLSPLRYQPPCGPTRSCDIGACPASVALCGTHHSTLYLTHSRTCIAVVAISLTHFRT